jgi:hypothetical protein
MKYLRTTVGVLLLMIFSTALVVGCGKDVPPPPELSDFRKNTEQGDDHYVRCSSYAPCRANCNTQFVCHFDPSVVSANYQICLSQKEMCLMSDTYVP